MKKNLSPQAGASKPEIMPGSGSRGARLRAISKLTCTLLMDMHFPGAGCYFEHLKVGMLNIWPTGQTWLMRSCHLATDAQIWWWGSSDSITCRSPADKFAGHVMRPCRLGCTGAGAWFWVSGQLDLTHGVEPARGQIRLMRSGCEWCQVSTHGHAIKPDDTQGLTPHADPVHWIWPVD